MSRLERLAIVTFFLALASAAVKARQLQPGPAEAFTTHSNTRSRGHITILGTTRDPAADQQLEALLAMSAAEPVSKSSSSSKPLNPRRNRGGQVTPTAKANIKRVFFQNNCTCASQDVFPVIALSYKPVQAMDFYTIGYWELAGCQSRYLLATTWGSIGIWGELNNGDTEWAGDVPLTIYNPAEDQCEKQQDFVEYNLSNNWQDYTVYLNC